MKISTKEDVIHIVEVTRPEYECVEAAWKLIGGEAADGEWEDIPVKMFIDSGKTGFVAAWFRITN